MASAARMLVLGTAEYFIWARYHIAAVAILAAILAVLELLAMPVPHTWQAGRSWGRHRRR